jgi:hypothetical protein
VGKSGKQLVKKGKKGKEKGSATTKNGKLSYSNKYGDLGDRLF